MGQPRILAMHPDDNVVLCLDPVLPGDVLAEGVIAAEVVPAGHKIALGTIAPGEAVRKYGQVVGLARAAIAPGAHVHVHNVSADVGDLRSTVQASGRAPPAARRASFRGFRRPSGKVGTRNYIGILASVNCSANVTRAIAAAFPDAMFAMAPARSMAWWRSPTPPAVA